jgi:hypothetical protein
MAARRRQVRFGAAFDQAFVAAGLGTTDESTLIRALVLLGLAAAGIDVRGLAGEALRLAGAPLAAEVRAALLNLYAAQGTAVLQPYSRQGAPPPAWTSSAASRPRDADAEQAPTSALDGGLVF